MRRRTAAGAVVATIASVVCFWEAAPSSSLGETDVPQLWGSERPAELVEVAFPGDLVGSQDGAAHQFADLSVPGGPLDPDECGELPIGPFPNTSLPFIEPGDTEIDFANVVLITFEAARLCDGPLGPETLLEVTGPASSGGVTGTARVVIARPAADQPFGRSALEYGGAQCTVIGSIDGFPGTGTEDTDYAIQSWGFAGDPAVDCASRSVAQETTTTASQVPTSTTSTSAPSSSTSATTVSTAAPAPAAAAQPVSGTSTYAG